MKNQMKKHNLETQEKKEKNFEIIAKIVMIILLILVIIFFVYPGILIKNIKESKMNKNVQNAGIQGNVQVDENNFIEYSEGIFDDENFIIGKKSDGKWYEIKSNDETLKMIGKYDDKLYYYDENGISYVNIYGTELTDKQWLKYKKYKISDTSETGNMEIEKAVMIEDTIYFSYSINSTGTLETDGILSIKISDTSLDNAVQILSNANNFYWDIDENNNEIYYMDNSDETPLMKYNIQTKKAEKIFDSIESFKLFDNEKILYFNLDQSLREESVSIMSLAKYNLCLYNINTKENEEIFSSSVSDIDSSNLWQLVDYGNDDVYYKNDNNILKYNKGTNETVYTYSSEDSKLNGFEFLNENIIKINIQDDDEKYLINGTLLDEIPSNCKTTVKMQDGEESSVILVERI